MKNNVENYVQNAATYFNDLATTYTKLTNTNTSIQGTSLQMPSPNNNETSNSTSGSNSTMESILPSTIRDPKTYNLNGYLPFTSSITFTMDDNSFCTIMTH